MPSTDTNTINRRQFLRGNFRQDTKSIRPPWALANSDFINACSRCNECVDKCPEKIIVKDEDGFPIVDFGPGGCTFCQACVAACADGALSKSNTEQLPWGLKADISKACISLHGVTCRACADSCEEEAISFRPQVGGVSLPEINTSSCTGCGFCLATCPVTAIKVSEKNERGLRL